MAHDIPMVLATYKNAQKIYHNYQMANMTKEDVRGYASRMRASPADLLLQLDTVIALLIRANELFNGQRPRIPQVLAVLLLLQRTKGKNRLLQQATGEGKSATCAMMAVILALQGQFVDVITSSPLLAKRDADDRRPFFEMFGLRVAHNADINGRSGAAACYDCDIVYGSAHDFQAHHLYQVFKGFGTRGSRRYDFAIVDEVDSMLIDEKTKKVMLTRSAPGMELLLPILVDIWNDLVTSQDLPDPDKLAGPNTAPGPDPAWVCARDPASERPG
ncbi:Helicase conserved C-terminal domain containing protein [Aphelenchoides avenae]|nr:Helicase conserved C-terminal domain containing protein [Aphelenchus avenae]